MKDKIDVRVFKSFKEAEEAEDEFWSLLKPEERVAAVDECVRDYLKMKNEGESRLRRVLKVLKRPWS
ncbi:hypothetical protein KAT51_08625 [bacterium]|nr:hypothetical protein [bacterium]